MKTEQVFSHMVHGVHPEPVLHSEAQGTEYLEGWKRARADYENLSRRSAEEREQARTEGAQRALLSLMDVIDHFDTALSTIPEELHSHQWVQGIRHIYSGFTQALAREGVEIIHDLHTHFDPKRHEVVETAEDAAPAGEILQVLSRGYIAHDRVLRPARVRVSKGKTDQSLTSAALGTSTSLLGDEADAREPSTLKTHK